MFRLRNSIVRRSCGKLWRVPCGLLPVLLDVPSGHEACLSGSRSSGTKKSLEFQRSLATLLSPTFFTLSLCCIFRSTIYDIDLAELRPCFERASKVVSGTQLPLTFEGPLA